MKYIRLIIFSLVTVLSINIIVLENDSLAISGDCFFEAGVYMEGGDCGTTGEYAEYGVNDVLTGRDSSGNGKAITGVNDVGSLVSFLKSKLYGSDTHDQIGAAFIIMQLINECRSDCKWPTADDVAEFEDRMTKPENKVTVSVIYSDVGETSYYDPDKKNVFYGPHVIVNREVIEIQQNGEHRATIETGCGNLVANPIVITDIIIPPPPTSNVCRPLLYEVNGHTDVNGSEVSISIKVVNDTTGRTVYSTTVRGDDTLDLTKKCTTGDTFTVYEDIANHKQTKRRSCHTTSSGSTSCHWVYTYDNPSETSGKIGPCFDYRLNTGITSLNYLRAEPNATVDIQPTLASDAWTKLGYPSFYSKYRTHTKTKTSEWQITKLTYLPNIMVPSTASASNPNIPCNHYSGKDKCEVFNSGSGVFSNASKPTLIGSGNSPLKKYTDKMTDLPAGTKICYTFSFKASSSDPSNDSFNLDNMWQHSSLKLEENCVIIVKKPKVQVIGGDLIVGRTNTSPTTNSQIYTTISDKGNYFGSWGEYGLFATGKITGMASGSAFASPTGSNLKQICNYSTLTFGNADNPVANCTASSSKGKYKQSTTIVDVASTFVGKGDNLPPNISVDNFFSGNGLRIGERNGNLNLTESILESGKSVVLKVNGTVTISGNQIYENKEYHGISEIPQLVIIADKIIINSDATQVDAWLVANDSVQTCNVNTDTYLTINHCNRPLTVNGPVITNKLYMLRTAGSEPNEGSGDPAETFNLRADAYLWSFARASSSGRIQTVYTTELPPRF